MNPTLLIKVMLLAGTIRYTACGRCRWTFYQRVPLGGALVNNVGCRTDSAVNSAPNR